MRDGSWELAISHAVRAAVSATNDQWDERLRMLFPDHKDYAVDAELCP
jgi:hypothetical protein